MRDHPRVCGEHVRSSTCPEEYRGSSPRMRGTQIGISHVFSRLGIIPAYAGNTLNRLTANISIKDHPRVCGEHSSLSATMLYEQGSSPRMRGTHNVSVPHVPRNGIIPAYAGNTSGSPVVKSVCWDHPRVCGEHNSEGYQRSRRQGSSPRMRGTLI